MPMELPERLQHIPQEDLIDAGDTVCYRGFLIRKKPRPPKELPVSRRLTDLPSNLEPAAPCSPSGGYTGKSCRTTSTATPKSLSDGSSSADSGWEPSFFENDEPEIQEELIRTTILTKMEALELQRALLQAFQGPSFQRDLRELAEKHQLANGKTRGYMAGKVGFMHLVRGEQMKVLPDFGFEASEHGVEAMLRAFAEWKGDPDIQVHEKIIQDSLRSSEAIEPPKEAPRVRDRPRNKLAIEDMLRALLFSFSQPWFQDKVHELKRSADFCSGRVRRNMLGGAAFGHSADPEGYYQLSGRAELAMLVHEKVLPSYSFEGTPEGVQEMLVHVAPYLGDKDVALLFDSINGKLGMESNGQLRFRRLAHSAEGLDLQALRCSSPQRRRTSRSPSPRRAPIRA
ncbi:unnamed protein product [Effrenium voratum]|nr:unnamed protein product [Effrenium voratum]